MFVLFFIILAAIHRHPCYGLNQPIDGQAGFRHQSAVAQAAFFRSSHIHVPPPPPYHQSDETSS